MRWHWSVALRQQLIVLKRKHPRPRLSQGDRLFWVALRHFWSRWAEALIVVKPETVVSWHRAGFRLYLALPFSPTPGSAKNYFRPSWAYSSHGQRESPLGRAQDSR